MLDNRFTRSFCGLLMEDYFVTTTGMNPYKINRLVKLVNGPDNPHGPEAICVEFPFIDTIGYVSNIVETVFAGTRSVDRLYE